MVKNKSQLRKKFREKAVKMQSPYFVGENLNKKIDELIKDFIDYHDKSKRP